MKIQEPAKNTKEDLSEEVKKDYEDEGQRSHQNFRFRFKSR